MMSEQMAGGKRETMHPDLFGGQTRIIDRGTSPLIKLKARIGYRQAENKTERCKNCDHLITQEYHGRRYYKCALIGISRCESTDVRLKNVCNRFEPNQQ